MNQQYCLHKHYTIVTKKTLWKILYCYHQKIHPKGGFFDGRKVWKLLLCLFVDGVLFAPPTVLFKLNFPLNAFPVLATPIVDAFAILARQFY